VSFSGFLLLYLILSLSVAIPLLGWTILSLREVRASDPLVALGIGAGLLLFPMLFVSGGWWLAQAVARSGGSPSRRRVMVAAYSAAVLVLWLCLRVVGRGFEQGTSVGWLVTLSSLAGYSSYLVLPVAAVTGFAALVGAVVARSKREQVPGT
jgi:hypothetical protein